MISVLVVDDSVVVRKLVTDALGGTPNIEVVGTAANGLLAQARIDQLRPDVVTMDIEMPEMNGIEAVKELRKRHPRLPVIMFSTLSAAGASATLEALAAGATDYVTKPSNVGSVADSIAAVRDQLVPKIHALVGRPQPAAASFPAGGITPATRPGPAVRPGPPPSGPPRTGPQQPGPQQPGPAQPSPQQPGRPQPGRPQPGRPQSGRPQSGRLQPGESPAALTRPGPLAPGPARIGVGAGRPAAAGPPTRRVPHGRIDIIAVGASTGGPDALTKVLQALPTDLPVPIVVTQHMPPVFTRMFAERLDRSTPLTVVEAAEGMELAPGTVYIAPGDKHLVLHRRGTAAVIQLSGAPPENSCRPAVDVMFRSVAQLFGGSAYATVLTGMGHDGRTGAKALRDAGAEVLAQDEASSVVWGMPGAVVGAGLADEILPLDRIASCLSARTKVGRSAAVAR